MKRDFKKGFQKALRESYVILENLLNEGMDIHAFKKLSDDAEFQKACKVYSSRIKNDDDAKAKFNLSSLNDFKENPEGFIKAVQNAVEYVEKRKNQKSIRKAQTQKGVDIVYEDEKCIITSPETLEYARAAGSLIKQENGCPWCIAAPFPDNQRHWKRYKVEKVFFVFQKRKGEPVNGWCLVMTLPECLEMVSRGVLYFSQIENLKNRGNDQKERRQNALFEKMLKVLKFEKEEFSQIIFNHLQKQSEYFKRKWNEQKLFAAIKYDDRTDVERFLRTGVDVNARVDDETALTLAILNGHREICQSLLEWGADVDAQNALGQSPLMLASIGGKDYICQLLLTHGADVNAQGSNLQNALHYAVSRDYSLGCCKLLVAAGANINARDERGLTPLAVAKQLENDDVSNFLEGIGAAE